MRRNGLFLSLYVPQKSNSFVLPPDPDAGAGAGAGSAAGGGGSGAGAGAGAGVAGADDPHSLSDDDAAGVCAGVE